MTNIIDITAILTRRRQENALERQKRESLQRIDELVAITEERRARIEKMLAGIEAEADRLIANSPFFIRRSDIEAGAA